MQKSLILSVALLMLLAIAAPPVAAGPLSEPAPEMTPAGGQSTISDEDLDVGEEMC
jgi:hypothetical protein